MRFDEGAATRPSTVGGSVAPRLGSRGQAMLWGATGAYVCGVAAAVKLPPSTGDLVRLLAGWFVVVPLLGSLWFPVLGSTYRLTLPRRIATDETRLRLRVWLRHLGSQVPSERPLEAAMALSLAVVVGALLGAGIATIVVVVLVGLAAHVLLKGEAPAETGATRSGLEILVPALVGWLAGGGPAPLPAPLAVGGGAELEILYWARSGLTLPLAFAAFALVHHGATAVHSRPELGPRRRQMILGYSIAVAILAAAARPFNAGAVALLFVMQWPFQAAFRIGYVRWHWRSIQPLYYCAMLVTAVGLRDLP